MSEPGQQSMDADAPEKTSVLDISKFSSADFQEILRSKEMSAKERFGLWLFGHKFGNTEKTKLQQCLQKMKQVLPELAEKDRVCGQASHVRLLLFWRWVACLSLAGWHGS